MPRLIHSNKVMVPVFCFFVFLTVVIAPVYLVQRRILMFSKGMIRCEKFGLWQINKETTNTIYVYM